MLKKEDHCAFLLQEQPQAVHGHLPHIHSGGKSAIAIVYIIKITLYAYTSNCQSLSYDYVIIRVQFIYFPQIKLYLYLVQFSKSPLEFQ